MSVEVPVLYYDIPTDQIIVIAIMLLEDVPTGEQDITFSFLSL